MSDARSDYVRLPIYREKLARALRFTEADLEENRAGRLSESQRSTLMRGVTRSAIKSGVFGFAGIVFLAGGFATGLLETLFLIPLVLVAACVLWVVIFARAIPPALEDAGSGAVSGVEGFVAPAERSAGPTWRYSWVVDGRQRFNVPGEVYPLLTPARHRLYFVPASRRIVAAEPIS